MLYETLAESALQQYDFSLASSILLPTLKQLLWFSAWSGDS